MRNISVKLFDFGPMVQETLFKGISYLQLWQPFCSAKWNHVCYFDRGHNLSLSVVGRFPVFAVLLLSAQFCPTRSQ